MHKAINDLIQLQELSVARAQQEASMGGKHLGQLDEAITAIKGTLPTTVASQYTRLQQKGILAIIPVSNNVCTACGMSLPKSLVQAIRLGEQIFHCPSCARFLYAPRVDLRSKGKRHPRNAPPVVGITRFSSQALMIPSLEAKTVDQALAELSEKLEDEGFIEDSSKILDEALNREAIASTAVGNGIAFPHVRGVEGGGLMLTLGVSRKGIRFQPDSRTLTRILLFMVIPTAASSFYLTLLSGLTQTFSSKENRDKLLAATTEADLWKTLVKLTKTTVK